MDAWLVRPRLSSSMDAPVMPSRTCAFQSGKSHAQIPACHLCPAGLLPVGEGRGVSR